MIHRFQPFFQRPKRVLSPAFATEDEDLKGVIRPSFPLASHNLMISCSGEEPHTAHMGSSEKLVSHYLKTETSTKKMVIENKVNNFVFTSLIMTEKFSTFQFRQVQRKVHIINEDDTPNKHLN